MRALLFYVSGVRRGHFPLTNNFYGNLFNLNPTAVL